MKKLVALLVVFVFTLLLFAPVTSLKASGPTNPVDIVRENLKNYLQSNLKVKTHPQVEPTVEIDGVELPEAVVKAYDIKSGNDLITVYIPGDKNPLLSKKVTLNDLKAEHATINSKIAQANVTVEDKDELYVAANAVGFRTKVKDLKKLYQVFGKDKVRISNVYKVELGYSVPLIGADSVWTDPGVNGSGIYVGVVDTGIDYTHPDFGGDGANHGFPTAKVVAGYDFGDNDHDPMDLQSHGTHVSGIMAADGQVKGVAPKAKIVIAKIVKGGAGEATGFDIARAFDYMADPDNLDGGPEGAHPKVTAVNMSFGSPYGFVDPFDIEHWAIEVCIGTGVFVSLAAGNDYWAYADTFGTSYKYQYIPDWASVGDPSITPSAMSVAASYNSYGKYPALTKIVPAPQTDYAYTIGSGSPDPVTTLGDNSGLGYEYVYCGLGGSASDFPPEVSGRIALIKRGTCTFLTKVQNAYNAGAIGVIIYNNTSGYITMNTDGQPSIPAVFISLADGNALLPYAVNGSTGGGKVGFRPNTYADVPQVTDTMVDFSSWGPPPDLSFKPEITAPGGGIWSTVPVAMGSYANYSGTSMAAPHVGAAAALVKQARPNLQVSDVKTALMNTAKLITDSTGFYYSPHLAGAGRVDVKAAVKTPVLVMDFDPHRVALPFELPYADLGEQPDYKTQLITFNLRLKNLTSNSVTYTVDPGNVQTVDYKMRSQLLPGATITALPGTVTVPANGYASVTVTIDARNCSQLPYNFFGYILDHYVNYLEGFVRFIPGDPTLPEIHIPYMGILGKWNQFTDEDAWDFNPIIDPPADDPYNLIWWWYGDDYIDTWPEITDGQTYWNFAGRDFYGYLDRNAIAVNTDREYFEADFGLLRNAQNVTIEIRDTSGNLVKTIDSVDWMYKDPSSALDMGIWYYSNPWTGEPFWWDGTDNSGNPVPDGQYKLVIKALPQKMFNKLNYDDPHIVEFPVSLDRVAPSTSWNKVTNGDGSVTVSWSVTDPAPSSGIWGYLLTWAGGGNYAFVPPTQNSYTIPAGQSTDDLIVFAIDNAWNIGFGSSPVLSLNPKKVSVNVFETASTTLSVTGGTAPYTFSVASVTPKPAGSYIVSNVFKFTPLPPDAEKKFVFTLKVIDPLGREGTETFTVNVNKLPDTTPPTLILPTINGIDVNTPNATLSINQNSLTFTVQASDESGIARMVVKVNGVVQIDKNNLDPTIYLYEGVNTVEVTVYDTAGNLTTKSFKIVKDTTPPTVILTSQLPDVVTTPTITLKGTVIDTVSGVKSLKVNGVDVPFTLEGNFETTLTLTSGSNTIAIAAEDKLQNTSTKILTVTLQSQTQKSKIITLQIGSPYITIDFATTQKIDVQGSKPIIKNRRTLLPIRTLIETLGGKVSWFDKENKVVIELNGHSVVLWIGKTTALVDGSKVTLDVAPEIINGRTYLPLRFISESLGMVVDWDVRTQTITIYYWP